MKRKLFFLLEKLKITPAERKAVSVLAIFLITLASVNSWLTPSVPFEDGYYRKLEKQFAVRTAMLRAKEQKLMQRYFPGKTVRTPRTAFTDTVTADSTENGKRVDTPTEGLKGRININTADRKALETLPGIGPVYAKRIIAYRKTHGKFTTFKELLKIKGIGKKRLDKLKPFVKLRDSE